MPAIAQILQVSSPKPEAKTSGLKAPALRDLEQELVLLCSKTSLTPAGVNRVSFILSLNLDWKYVLGIAFRNGVLPLVCKNLSEKFADALPDETFEEIKGFYREHAQNNILLTSKLIEIVKMLDAAGIPCLPFKGPLLALRAYKNLALRQFVDLDIMVPPKDFDRAVKLLLENDFKIYPNAEPKKTSSLFINRRKDIGLIGPDEKVRVELHWKLSGSYFALPLELKELWNRLDTATLGGCRINTLPFKDLFVYLCLHGARHGFERLAWVCDLCELIKAEKDIDWDEIRLHAKEHGCEKVVELGLFLADDFFGLKTVYFERKEIGRDPVLRRAAASIRKKIFAEKFSSTEIGEWYLYHLALKEKKFDRLKLHIHYLFWYLKLTLKPNSLDKSIFQLPPVFYPLYYVLRPSRLLFSYFSKAAARAEQKKTRL